MIILVRHGFTQANEDRVIPRAHEDDLPLSLLGRRDVVRFKLGVAYPTHVCLCSPKQRCRQTARLMGLSHAVEPLLDEMDLSGAAGMTYSSFFASDLYRAWRAGGPSPGIEPIDHIANRVQPVAERLRGAVLPTIVVSHQAVLCALVALLRGTPVIDGMGDSWRHGEPVVVEVG